MLKKLRKIGILLFSFSLLIACSAQKNNDIHSYEYKKALLFKDDLNNEFELYEKPQKVAVLFSSFADIWITAGGTVDITVKESVERGFANEQAVLVDEGAGKSINVDALIMADPDLVLCSADIEAQTDAAKLLNKSGIPAACFRVESFGDYLNVLNIFAQITGNDEAYKKYGLDVQCKIDELLKKYSRTPDFKNILFIRAGSGSSSTKAKKAEDHFAAAMLEELGTYNIANEAPVLLDGLSIEEVIEVDPDFIFISTMGNTEAAIANMDVVLSEKTWQSLSAVQEGRYVYLPKDLFQFKPNARWLEAYEYLIELIYDE